MKANVCTMETSDHTLTISLKHWVTLLRVVSEGKYVLGRYRPVQEAASRLQSHRPRQWGIGFIEPTVEG